MTCREARRLYSDYSDAAGAGSARRTLAQHLESCAACREEYRLLDQTRRLLATYGPAPCPVDLTHLALQPSFRARAPWMGGWRHARLALASLAVLLVAGGWQWQRAAVSSPPAPARPAQLVIRDVAEVQELHESFTVQQSLQGRDGLLLFAPDWGERGR